MSCCTPRTLVILTVLVTACGSSKQVPAPLSPAPPPTDEDCAAQVESSPPGNHDRYAFSDDDGATYGYKDGRGTVVIAPRFRFAYEFGLGGVAAAVEPPAREGGVPRFVFIDSAGNVLAVAYAFDNGPDYFQEGLARIIDDGKIGYLDRAGAIVIAPQFAGATGFCHGHATVHDVTSEWEIDRAGKPSSAKRPHVEVADPCGED